MNETKLIDQFWRDCDEANFSKEAIVLFFYLLYLYHKKREKEIKMHPNKLSSVVKGFTQQNVIAASEELARRGYVDYTPADETHSSGVYRFIKEEEPRGKNKKS